MLLRFVFRRESGAARISMLLLVLLADAAQNAMADDYTSVTDGLLLVATIMPWDFMHAGERRVIQPLAWLLHAFTDETDQRNGRRSAADVSPRAEGMMRIEEVMVRDVVTIDSGATLLEAAKRMREANVGILPVVEGGVLRGVLTDRDLVVRAIARNADPSSTRVGDCATDKPLAVRPEWDVDQAMDLMGRRQVGRLPVVDDQDRPIGIVTLSSLALRAREDAEVLSTAKTVARRSAKGGPRPVKAGKRKPPTQAGGRSHRVASRVEPGKRRLKRAG